MSLPFEIRKLEPKDAEAWAALRWEALANHPLAFGASLPGSMTDLADMVRPRLSNTEESTIFGAFIDLNLIGIVGIVRESTGKERHKARIWGMYVGSSNRRAGIGESLLKAAIRQAEAWNILQVVLSVTDVAKDARRLYERHGFRSWGLEPRAMCVDGVYADEAYMTLQLDGSVDPAPKRWSVAPYFIVDDVVATANYYRDKLGFNYERFWNDPPSFCMVEREGIVIMLGQLEATGVMRPNRTVDPEGGAWDTYIYVGDADGLHSEFKSKGVKIVREISDRPYGCRDFDIDDCNGYRLCFGQILGEE